MRSIKALLNIYNTSVEQLEVNELIEIEGGPGIMDLTIEKVSPDRLSVAHYYIQNGDPKRDPEVVFDTSGENGRQSSSGKIPESTKSTKMESR